MPTSSPASPNDPSSLDHHMSGSGVMSASAGSDDGNDNDGRKGYGKRELSTSKRAAQNRAAQVSQHIDHHHQQDLNPQLLQTSLPPSLTPLHITLEILFDHHVTLPACFPPPFSRTPPPLNITLTAKAKLADRLPWLRERSGSGKRATSRNSRTKFATTTH